MARFLRSRSWLWLILALSLLLRASLALRGGQLFYGDESRYYRGPALYHGLLNGNWTWIRSALVNPEHAGFTYIALLVAPFHHLLANLIGLGDWSTINNSKLTLELAAMVLGGFSTLSLWLVHCLARQAGASLREANFATLFAACSTSLFYYSRHLLPYDSALAAALTALIFCVSGTTRLRQLMGGLFAGLTYEIYNGYWFLVPLTALVLFFSQPNWSERVRAISIWVAGFLIATVLIMAPGAMISGQNYWMKIAGFSQSVNQGAFAEGWSLPWAYLKESEGVAGLLLAGITLIAVMWDSIRGNLERRAQVWVALFIGIYFLLVLFSVGLEKFVVYGRSARTLVPFVCLAAGYAVERFLTAHLRWQIIIAGMVIFAAGINFTPSFTVIYDQEVKRAIWRAIGTPKQALSFSGSIYRDPIKDATRPDLVLVNAAPLYPLREYIGYPAGQILLSIPHTLSFLPYHYDGYSPRERRLLREHPPLIKLIRLNNPGSLPDNPPAEMLARKLDLSDGHDQRR